MPETPFVSDEAIGREKADILADDLKEVRQVSKLEHHPWSKSRDDLIGPHFVSFLFNELSEAEGHLIGILGALDVCTNVFDGVPVEVAVYHQIYDH